MNPQPPTPFRPRSTLLLAFNKTIQQEWEHQIISEWVPDPTQPPTPEQEAILQYISPQGSGFPANLMLRAFAGTGKTNTLFRILRTLPGAWPGTAEYCARFGPQKGQLVPFCPTVKTSHAFGLQAWREYNPRTEISTWKCFRISRDLGFDKKVCPNLDQPLSSLALPLVDKAKNWGLGDTPKALLEDTPENWEMLASHFSLPISPATIETARTILAESISRARTPHDIEIRVRGRKQIRKNKVELDFADMLYMPLLYRGAFDKFDLVVADEFQDFSPLRAELISRALRGQGKGRLLAAGDENQAIYGFTGASPQAMQDAIQHFEMDTRPLTWSFRCARAIIEEAQQVVPGIQAPPWANKGKVQKWPESFQPPLEGDEVTHIVLKTLPHAILCPLNAPLATLALALLRHRHPVRILGREGFLRDITPLLEAASDSPHQSIPHFLIALQLEVQRRSAKAPKSAYRLADQARTLRALAQGTRDTYGSSATTTHISQFIESLWVQDREDTSTFCGFTLSTIHKAKGLEWDEVGILEQDQIGRWAKTDWEQDAARHLLYVALTRARNHLVLNIPLQAIEGVQESKEAQKKPTPAPIPTEESLSDNTLNPRFDPFA